MVTRLKQLFPTLAKWLLLWLLFVGLSLVLWGVHHTANAANAEIVPEHATAVAEQDMTSAILATLPLSAQPEAQVQSQAEDDLACRLCHQDTDEMITFPSGESVSVQVEVDTVDGSVHGQHADSDLGCTSCHAPAEYQFPHEPVEADSLRDYQLQQSNNCQQCHQEPHLTSHPGPETLSFVTCIDCHGSHDVASAAEWMAGEGTEACIECHTEAEVPRTDAFELTTLINDDLFAEQVDNDYCLSCHSLPDFVMELSSGDEIPLTIDEETFADSVHGHGNEWQPLNCTSCHENYRFPHDPLLITTARGFSLRMYPLCAECHEQKYEQTLDDAHGAALDAGNEEAAVCTDCHGAHDTVPPGEPREQISQTCRQCHSSIYDQYAESVHGEALLTDSNPDVPTCIDCHGVHNISDPTTNLFRIRSPKLCAKCHADEDLMGQYDISTEVFETYVADFHGTTVTLFEHQDPDVETNKAVCYDCHGVHDIKAPDDPEAGIKANLLETCRQCHPDASANFPDSWTSHFKPSLDNNPLVYLVQLFYQIVIPATVGFFGFMVLTDVYRRVRLRIKR